ncbi:uncharacterized protein [Diadema setosum]|uniref:uncharacterized protein n=1 Tax=Diadema setosum TaxID=31175 RepID=UPI003B3BE504
MPSFFLFFCHEHRDMTVPSQPLLPETVSLVEIFSLVDSNNDGHVTSVEWTALFRIIMLMYDSNGDGKLSLAEVQPAQRTSTTIRQKGGNQVSAAEVQPVPPARRPPQPESVPVAQIPPLRKKSPIKYRQPRH